MNSYQLLINLYFQYIHEWGVGRASTISTKVMDLRAVRQYVCCLQLITKSRCLLEKATLYFVFYRITYYALVFFTLCNLSPYRITYIGQRGF